MTIALKNKLNIGSCKLEPKQMLAEASENLGEGGALEDYDGKVFLDVKQLLQNSTSSSADVLEAAKDFIDEYTTGSNQADGIRVPIFFAGQADSFDSGILRFDVAQDVIKYAKEADLEVYANPAGAGNKLPDSFRSDSSAYAERVSTFANRNEIDYLGPFNEPGLSMSFMEEVTDEIDLPSGVETVGPDLKLLSTTTNYLGNDRAEEFLSSFDILASHNLAVNDVAGNADAWDELKDFADDNDQDLWDSEAINTGTNRNRVLVAAEAELDGIVLYESSKSVSEYT